jgi:hypothetical protein
MANGTPNRTLAETLRGNIALETDTLRVALYNDTVAFTFDPSAHEFVADVLDGGTTAEEFGGAGGTGYSRQGLANATVTEDDTNNQADFDADDLQFADLDGETIQGAIIYKQVGGDDTTPADDPIIQVYDNDQGDVSDFPIATNGSTIELQFDAGGLLSVEAI